MPPKLHPRAGVDLRPVSSRRCPRLAPRKNPLPPLRPVPSLRHGLPSQIRSLAASRLLFIAVISVRSTAISSLRTPSPDPLLRRGAADLARLRLVVRRTPMRVVDRGDARPFPRRLPLLGTANDPSDVALVTGGICSTHGRA